MGEGDYKKGKMYYKLVALLNFVLNLIIAASIYFNRELVARVYTTSEELIPMVKDAYTVMIVNLFFYGFAMV